MGLHRAWPEAEITGVDIRPQPRYPFKFVQADAMTYPLEGYDFIWASPPCQAYTSMRALGKGAGEGAPDLVNAVRERLTNSGTPFVIENVMGAPLRFPLVLCGTMFGLRVRRHRIFESPFLMLRPSCRHDPRVRMIAVYGDHPEKSPIHRRKGSRNRHGGGAEVTWRACSIEEAREAMGINWMEWKELTQAVPPAYSEYIARQWRTAGASG